MTQAATAYAAEIDFSNETSENQEVAIGEDEEFGADSNTISDDVSSDNKSLEQEIGIEEITLQDNANNKLKDLVIDIDEDQIILSWEPALNADMYNIYRAECRDGFENELAWNQLGTIQDCTYIDKIVVPSVAVAYQYKVTAVSETEETLYAQTNKPYVWETAKNETDYAEYNNVEDIAQQTDTEDSANNSNINKSGKLSEEVKETEESNKNDTEEVAAESYTDTSSGNAEIEDDQVEESEDTALMEPQDSSDSVQHSIKTLSAEEVSENTEQQELTNVEGLTASSESYNKILVRWNSKEGADGYLLYTKGDQKAKWVLLKELSKEQTSFSDTVVCGSMQYYTVRAYRTVDNDRQLGEMNETGVHTKAVPFSPVAKVRRKSPTTLNITWNKVDGASGYRLYRKLNKKDKWKSVKTFKSKTFGYNDPARKCGVSYMYAVQAYRIVSGKKICSGYSKSVTGHTSPDKGTLISIDAQSPKSAKLRWNKTKYASGYQIARKTSPTETYDIIGTASSTTYTDANLTGSGATYYYRFRPYINVDEKRVYGSWSPGKAYTHYAYKYYINTRKVPEKIDLPGVEQFQYGKSGQGRPLYAYKVGNGSKHMVLNFAIHGWEDHWRADGYELTRIAVKLLEKLSANKTSLDKEGWTIVVVPCANPDGYYNGYSCNGPGRCTTRRYDSSGTLVKGGLDLNRSFPAGFVPKYNSRNYTGPESLMAREGQALRDLLVQFDNNSKDVYFDVHGWTQQILTNRSGAGMLYKTMHKYFPQNSAGSNGGPGYAAHYAKTLGYDACLFEFPRNVKSHSTIVNNGYDTKFVSAIWSLIKNY